MQHSFLKGGAGARCSIHVYVDTKLVQIFLPDEMHHFIWRGGIYEGWKYSRLRGYGSRSEIPTSGYSI